MIFIPVGIPIFEIKNKQRNKISAQSIFDKFPVLNDLYPNSADAWNLFYQRGILIIVRRQFFWSLLLWNIDNFEQQTKRIFDYL